MIINASCCFFVLVRVFPCYTILCTHAFPVFTQRSFDVALRSSLERIVTASGPGFGDWQWRLDTLPFEFGGLGVYFEGFRVNYGGWAGVWPAPQQRIVTASGPGFGDWQWRLDTLPFAFGGLGVYFAGDVLNYAFLASRLQSAGLQIKLLRHTSIVSPGPIFNDALSVFNASMETDLLSNP
nr:auxilin-like protein [Tanacetum cinerariifolium]